MQPLTEFLIATINIGIPLLFGQPFLIKLLISFNRISRIMRSYCEEAATYGDNLMPLSYKTRHVLVVLNPIANKRSAESLFAKYCEPILHVAGIKVDIVKTESEEFARKYVEELTELPDAIVIAGGDGTISQIITGLLRPNRVNNNCPIGIIPVGRNNSIGVGILNASFKNRETEARSLADASLCIVKGNIKKQDVIKIEILEDEEMKKPIFAMASIKLGAFRDSISKRDKYWYLGPVREYAAIFFCAFKSSINWNLGGEVVFTPPCSGCSNCYLKIENPVPTNPSSWWSSLVPRAKYDDGSVVNGVNLKGVINDKCSQEIRVGLDQANELYLTTSNTTLQSIENEDMPRMVVRIGEKNKSLLAFILEGWRRLTNNEVDMKTSETIMARTLKILPDNMNDQHFYSIDNTEDYEVKPIRVTLMPKFINVFVN